MFRELWKASDAGCRPRATARRQAKVSPVDRRLVGAVRPAAADRRLFSASVSSPSCATDDERQPAAQAGRAARCTAGAERRHRPRRRPRRRGLPDARPPAVGTPPPGDGRGARSADAVPRPSRQGRLRGRTSRLTTTTTLRPLTKPGERQADGARPAAGQARRDHVGQQPVRALRADARAAGPPAVRAGAHRRAACRGIVVPGRARAVRRAPRRGGAVQPRRRDPRVRSTPSSGAAAS